MTLWERLRIIRASKPQWSLRELLTFTLVAAIGAAAWRDTSADFWDALLALLLALMTLGLLQQAADLWRAMRGRADLTRDMRVTAWWEFSWRLAAAAILLVGGSRQAIANSAWVFFLFEWREPQVRATIWLATIVVIALSVLSPMSIRPRRGIASRRFHVVVELLACLGAAGIVAWAIGNYTVIPSLVAIATTGIGAAFPLQLAVGDPSLEPLRRTQLLEYSAAGALAAIIALVLSQSLARCGRQSRALALATVLALLATLVVAASAAIWILHGGARQALPMFLLDERPLPLSLALPAALLCAVIATALTKRYFSGHQPEALPMGELLSWRTRPGRYYHEQRWFAVALAIVVATRLVTAFIAAADTTGMTPRGFSLLLAIFGDSMDVPMWCVDLLDRLDLAWQVALAQIDEPRRLLWAALLIRAIGASFARKPPTEIPPLVARPSPLLFCVWLSVGIALAAGAVCIVWVGVAMWTSPNPLPLLD